MYPLRSCKIAFTSSGLLASRRASLKKGRLSCPTSPYYFVTESSSYRDDACASRNSRLAIRKRKIVLVHLITVTSDDALSTQTGGGGG